MTRSALALGLMALLLAGAARAADLRVSSAGDAGTMDPHSQNIIPTSQLLRQIYEPLINRGPDLQLEPALAMSWGTVTPTTWRFHLRPGVHFQDGSLLTAEDVVFSLKRAAAQTSNYANFVDTVTGAKVVDSETVDVTTREPDPILPDKLASVAIMSKAWCDAHHADQPQNAADQKSEAFTTMHTNGTGPFELVSRQPMTRTVLERFSGWWGHSKGNVTRYISLPIASGPTRVSAFLSGDIDVLLDPPLQDIGRLRHAPGVKILQGPEIRTMFIVMDQGRNQLLYSDVKGRNPFKDRRVRQALYQAVDISAIIKRIMHGFARPSALLFGPGVRGYDAALDVRPPYDPAKARALLSEAGYPNGFSVTLDCPNNRYINDAQVCAALAVMWAKIGVRVTVNAQPLALFFPRIQRRDTSMYFLGSGSPTLDAYYMFQIHLLPPDGRPGDGIWNLGGYDNPKMTTLIDSIRDELDPARRTADIHAALVLYKQDVAQIPLYDQDIAWAARNNIDLSIRPDDQLEAKWVTVRPQ